MYSITRQEAADILGVSTRTVDRYAKSGKIRSKKDGKIIYLHKQDILNLAGEGKQTEVIVEKSSNSQDKSNEKSSTEKNTSSNQSQSTNNSSTDIKSKNDDKTLAVQMGAQARAIENIYLDMRNQIQEKDKVIQDLSVELGKNREIAGNSISLVDHKKSQFLLEESKTTLSKEISYYKEENSKLSKKVSDEKKINKILIILAVILVLVVAFLFFRGV